MVANSTKPLKGSGPKLESHELSGFERWSDDIYVRRAERAEKRPASHPRYILIFGWGDALPKHIRKYSQGYETLFPFSAQVVCTCAIKRVVINTLEQRANLLQCIVEEVFPPGLTDDGQILAHAMSNTGSVYFGALVYAYRRLHDKTMPLRCVVLDSTPGRTNHTLRNVTIWSGSMAIRASKRYRIPFILAHFICMIVVVVSRCVGLIIGEEFSGTWTLHALNDEVYVPKQTRKLYLYGPSDSVIRWTEIEEHVGATTSLGWEVDTEVFDGTEHVSHMRKYPERYWGAIAQSWKKSLVAP